MKIYAVRILDISEKNLHNLCLLIDSEKRYKIEKFINKKDKIRTLVGNILIRTVISEELGIRNENIIFEKNKYGKPYLNGLQKFNFNISHSGDFVVCVIDEKPIGIDIEEVRHIEYKEIAESYFTMNEINHILEIDLENQLSRFYEIWTLKESFIKCCGQGLAMPLNSFSINIDRFDNINVNSNNENSFYKFEKFDFAKSYKLAVCSSNKETSSIIITIDQNELISKYYSIST